MRTYLDCIPCFFRQALFAARLAIADEIKIKQILDDIGRMLPRIPLNSPPPETGRKIYGMIRDASGVADPFKALKEKSIRQCMQIYPHLIRMVEKASSPLEIATKLAMAGNVIDFGANPDFDLEQDLSMVLGVAPAINDYTLFAKQIATAQNILYLGDNAGETVFDKILIETIGKRVVYAVRGAPVINDATLEDARESALDEVSELVSTGCDAPGVLLNRCTDEFKEYFSQADLIISKGQGNWEALSGQPGPIFHLLKVKCSVIAEKLGVAPGNIVLQCAEHRTC